MSDEDKRPWGERDLATGEMEGEKYARSGIFEDVKPTPLPTRPSMRLSFTIEFGHPPPSGERALYLIGLVHTALDGKMRIADKIVVDKEINEEDDDEHD